MKISVILRSVLLLAAAVFFSGCAGYHLGVSKPKFMGDIQTIAVPTFKNETLEPRIEVQAANAVINQIQRDGTYRVVQKDSADAILEGTVMKIDRKPARSVHGDAIATREFDLTVHLRWEVRRRVTGQVVESRSAVGTTSFFVGADIQEQERQAIPLALEDAAVSIVSILSEGW